MLSTVEEINRCCNGWYPTLNRSRESLVRRYIELKDYMYSVEVKDQKELGVEEN